MDVCSFEEISEGAHLGARAQMMGSLVKNGFPVADGFVLTPAFMKQLLIANGCSSDFFTALKSKQASEVSTVINRISFPPDFEDLLFESCAKVSSNLFNIRISSIFEDEIHSVYNVPTAELKDAVLQVWASLFNTRKMPLLTRSNSFPAIIIQKFVKAKSAGTLLTANPSTNSKEKMVLDIFRPARSCIVISKADYKILSDIGLKQAFFDKEDDLIKLAKQSDASFPSPKKIDWLKADKLYVSNIRDINRSDRESYSQRLKSVKKV